MLTLTPILNTSFSIKTDTYIKANTNMHNTDTNTYIDANTSTSINIDMSTPRQTNNHIHMDKNMYINTTTNNMKDRYINAFMY